jgi:hypothetical protein
VGATTVRRISKERVNAFHNKHRGALQVQPEVQDSWSEVSSTARRNHKTLHAPDLKQTRIRWYVQEAGIALKRCVLSLQVGRVVALRSNGEEVLVKWKGLDYGECVSYQQGVKSCCYPHPVVNTTKSHKRSTACTVL